jgi:hypothetical protein
MRRDRKQKTPLSDLEPEHELSASRLILGEQQEKSMRDRWISHRSHRQENVPVDHIFYLNPSEQVPLLRPVVFSLSFLQSISSTPSFFSVRSLYVSFSFPSILCHSHHLTHTTPPHSSPS